MGLLEPQLSHGLAFRLIGVRMSGFKNQLSRVDRTIASKHRSLDSYLNVLEDDRHLNAGIDNDKKIHLEVNLEHLGSQDDLENHEQEQEQNGKQSDESSEEPQRKIRISETPSNSSHSRAVDLFLRKRTTRCPICSVMVTGSVSKIDRHVDSCLQGSAVGAKRTIDQFYAI